MNSYRRLYHLCCLWVRTHLLDLCQSDPSGRVGLDHSFEQVLHLAAQVSRTMELSFDDLAVEFCYLRVFERYTA